MPDWKDEIRQRLGDLNLEPTREAEIVEELSQHLEDRYRELRCGGVADEGARLAVLAELSESEVFQRELRRVERNVTQEPVCLGAGFETTLGGRRKHMISDLWQDLRYGSRVLMKKPGFTAMTLITLALGVGANTAIFSVINGVLLRPLPYAEPEQLVSMGGWSRGGDKEMGVTPADLLDYREQNTTFAQFAASISDTLPATLTGSGEPERLSIAAVTANYLDVFGLKPELGRTFIDEEEQAGRGQVVVLSHGLWERHFGADSSVIDQTITLDGTSLTVIGVMPREFQYPPGAELWKPISFDGPPQSPMKSREFHFLRPVGRLKPGVTIEQAQAEIETISRTLELQYPKTNTNLSLYLMPLQERIVGKIKLTLVVLLGAVGFVLLIACANVANLLLVRAASRQKEMALRSALGASRGRIVRQMLAESLILALCGGLCGVILASWGADLLVALSAGDLPRSAEIGMDRTVLVFTFFISLLTGLVFGLAPALQSSRLDLNEALKEGGRSGGGSDQTNRARNLLVISECALAVVLLIGAGLLLKSFVKLQQVSPGFDEQNLLTAAISLPDAYEQLEKKAAFWSELQQRVAALPGVEAVGLVTELPLASQASDVNFKIEGRPAEDFSKGPHADFRNINHDYFRAMRMPLLRGRTFTGREVQESARVLIISDQLARRYFPDEDPIGQRLRFGILVSKEPFEIIGVVGDVRHRGLDGDLRETLYLPTLRTGWSNLVIRTETDPASLAAAVRREVTAIDPNQPVADIKTMERWVSESVARPRYRTLLLGVFSAVALILSVVGIFGVMSYSVTQRTHEFGIRMALGAQGRDVLKLVIGQGMVLALVGVATGLAASYSLTRIMRSLLFEVSTTDPFTFCAIAMLLTVVALVACYLPARRATKIDPLAALRHE